MYSVPHDATYSGYQYLFAWGKNDRGQLGTNDLIDKSTPTHYSFEFFQTTNYGHQFTSLTAGVSHSFATYRFHDSSGYWYRNAASGDKTYDQLFDTFSGSLTKTFLFPLWMEHPFLGEAGANHTFLIFQDGGTFSGSPLYGAGQNAQGNIGLGYFNGAFGSTPTYAQGYPQALYDGVGTTLGMTRFAAGANHNLAIKADGSLYVWGANKVDGVVTHALGLGGDSNPSVSGTQFLEGYQSNHNRPRLNPFLTNVVDVAAGGDSSFAVTRNGLVYAWGANAQGQLGVGGVAARTNPGAVSGGFRLWTDSDDDGLPDEWERYYWDDLSKGANDDPDADGVANGAEWTASLNPVGSDTDGDYLTDSFELANPTFDAGNPDSTVPDLDSDGLDNKGEYIYGSSPSMSDTDGDGVSDSAEVNQGSNPNSSSDGGQAPPQEELKEVPISIGGDYAAWEMVVTGKTPGDERVWKLGAREPGAVESTTIKLRKGYTYEVRMRWLKNKKGEKTNWYCWEARVDGLPDYQTYIDYTSTRLTGVATAFVVGGNWVAENAEGLLSAHVHMNPGKLGGKNVAGSAVATLLPVEFKAQNGKINYGFDPPMKGVPAAVLPVPDDPAEEAAWTSMILGETNDTVNLVTSPSSRLPLELHVPDGNASFFLTPEHTTISLPETPLRLEGHSAYASLIAESSVVLRTRTQTPLSVATLNVKMLPRRTVSLGIYRVVDSLSPTTSPINGPTDAAIIATLNDIFKQTGVTFRLDGSGTRDVTYDFNGDGKVQGGEGGETEINVIAEALAGEPGSIQLILTRESGIPYKTDATKFVRGVTGATLSVLFLDTIVGGGGNVAVVGAHELGHVLQLTSRNPTDNEATGDQGHDPGPFPFDYNTDGLMKSGGPDPITGIPAQNPGLWLPHEDWDKANREAQLYG